METPKVGKLNPEEIHAVLLAESKRTNLPKIYVDDVRLHDLAYLEESGTQDFLWLLRTCGSHLIPLDVPVNNRMSWIMAVNACGDEDQKRYRFRDGRLTEITKDEFGKGYHVSGGENMTTTLKVGKLYELSMPGEPDFGGLARVVKVTKSKALTRFEMLGWRDTETLAFKLPELKYHPVRHDAFPAKRVNFRRVSK